MQYAIAALALAGAVAAAPKPQAVTSAISPDETTPETCSSSYPGKFMISIANVTSTASKAKRQDSEDTALTVTLEDGVLIDNEGRTGYIASNNQFQFDGPAQAGAIYTAGWSACSNGTLALGDSAIFYQCLSGTFYNLYDESTGDQCSQIYINIIGDSSASTTTAASTTIASAATQLSDGQIQATTASPVVSQITDGQIQATTATAAVVSQITDGQIQATTAAPVTQITDGQIQASTAAAPVTQIADGQIQASNATVAATTAAPVTQIADGQIQASTGTAVVTQISDGQIQAATNGSSIATASPTIQAFTGAAALPSMRAELFGFAGLALAAVAML